MKVKEVRAFVYEGPVEAKRRPRASVRYRSVMGPDGEVRRKAVADSYGDSKDKGYEARIRAAYLEEWDGLEPMEGPVIIDIHAIFETHEKSLKKRRMAIGKPCLKKPDIDNITKSVMDSLNQNEKIGFCGAYKDDKQVYMVIAEKGWGINERIVVTLTEMEEEMNNDGRDERTAGRAVHGASEADTAAGDGSEDREAEELGAEMADEADAGEARGAR